MTPTPQPPHPAQILALPMRENDASANTVREYLLELLEYLWVEGESFSGKCPFGNSGWEYELYAPLIEAKFVVGLFDKDGYIASVDEKAAHEMILSAIRGLTA